VGPEYAAEGTYESRSFDAQLFSQWGRIEWWGPPPAAEAKSAAASSEPRTELFVRSGNTEDPGKEWSRWFGPFSKSGSSVEAPSARFVQWKAMLRTGTPAPRIDSVLLNYLPKNVAPQIDDVSVQLAVRYLPMPKSASENITLGGNPGQGQPHFDVPIPSTHDRDAIGVKWTAHDDNDDQLVYSVYYRGEGETRWLLLKDNVTDKYYSFDSGLLPDGAYTVKVVASDAPSHSPGDALNTEKESDRFEVDTTPPQIQNLTATLEGDHLHVSFRAADGFSTIKRAEYSMDAAEWQFIEPADQISVCCLSVSHGSIATG